MSKEAQEKERNYLNSMIKDKQSLVAHYKVMGNFKAVDVLESEIARVNLRIIGLQYAEMHEEVSIDALAEYFK